MLDSLSVVLRSCLFALIQILYTATELVLVEIRDGPRRSASEIRSVLFKESLLSLGVPAQIKHRHPAGSQHERSELFRFT